MSKQDKVYIEKNTLKIRDFNLLATSDDLVF